LKIAGGDTGVTTGTNVSWIFGRVDIREVNLLVLPDLVDAISNEAWLVVAGVDLLEDDL
jgi:hypothetical protein